MAVQVGTQSFASATWANMSRAEQDAVRAEERAKREKREVTERLEYLRGELRAETISISELAELQSLAERIELWDVELLEAAGVPENDD